MIRAATPALALALLLPLARADRLDKSRVPADARWIAHFDAEAALGSTLFRQVLERACAEIEVDGLAGLRAGLGVDPLKDVKSFTVFSTLEDPAQSVVLVSGTARLDELLPRLEDLGGLRTVTAGGVTVHAFGGPGEEDSGFGHLRPTPDGGRLALLSGDLDRLVDAILVLEGRAPNLAQEAPRGLLPSPAPGSILFAAAAHGLEEMGRFAPASAVARLVQGLVFDVGEQGEELFATLALEARSPEDAERVHQVLQGAWALASLAAGTSEVPPELARLLAALRFTPPAGTSRVLVDFRYDVRRLTEDLRSFQER